MDGSIHDRINKYGRKVYDVRYRVLDFNTGKKIQKTKRGFEKKSKAQAFLNKVLQSIDENKYIQTKNITLKELLNDWMTREVEGKLASNTVSGYRVNIDKHIVPAIGNIQLQKLTDSIVQSFYDYKLRSTNNPSGLSAKSIIYIHRNLKKALTYAVRRRYISYNPTEHVKLPTPEKFRSGVLSFKSIKLLLEIVKDEPIELWIALGGLAGMRRAEIAGLFWEDVDFEQKIITIQRQRDKNNNTVRLKTDFSYRTVRATITLMDILMRHKANQLEQKNTSNRLYIKSKFVCRERDGSIIHPSIYSTRFKKLTISKDFPNVRFHDLRHSFATNMIRMGVPINTVSKMLGHASPSITMDVYAHCLAEMEVEAVERLDSVLNSFD